MQPNFPDRIEQFQKQISSLENQLKKLSSLRLFVFVGALILIFLLANAKLISFVLITLLVTATGFGLILHQYNMLSGKRRHLIFLKRINEHELCIEQRKLKDIDTGKEFMTTDHAYAADLDVFGHHSLFQILNRTTTEPGKTQLADWLMQPAGRDLILARQTAVIELAPKLEWRQQFQAAGMPFFNTKSSYAQLVRWIQTPAELVTERRKYLSLAITLGLLTACASAFAIHHLALFLFSDAPFSITSMLPMLICLLVNKQVIKKLRNITERILTDLQYNVPALSASESLITQIQSTSFESTMLREWQALFCDKQYSTVKEIRRLRKTLEAFQQRGSRVMVGKNDFYGIFNSLFLLDIYFILSIEGWKTLNGSRLKEWSTTIGNFEAVNSVAGFAYSNPGFVFPKILDRSYQIDFKELGHPILKEQQRVCNDFNLQEKGSVVIITGSNMAGKSTFLRTVGCNLVLAMTGAPCCATSGQISPMLLFTSMRTQDNLEEGISSFYAELKRVEKLLQVISSGKPIFFLLDEMFKGTNSDDRYRGGVSLIKQLGALNAFGMISTHDLQLAKAASKHLPVSNYSFNSELREEKIIFNYKLTEGFCTDFNASALMKKSGIDILPEI